MSNTFQDIVLTMFRTQEQMHRLRDTDSRTASSHTTLVEAQKTGFKPEELAQDVADM